MKFKILVLILVIILGLTFVRSVLAANVEVMGKITNLDVTSQGSVVQFIDSSSRKIVLSMPLSPLGEYVASLPQGTYDISVIPPEGSDQQKITQKNQTLVSNTTNTITVPSSSHATNLTQQYQEKIYANSIIGIVSILLVIMIGYFIWRENKKFSGK